MQKDVGSTGKKESCLIQHLWIKKRREKEHSGAKEA